MYLILAEIGYLKQPEGDHHEEHLEESDENVGLRIGEQDEGQHGADAAVEHRGPDVLKCGHHPLVPLRKQSHSGHSDIRLKLTTDQDA